MKHFLIRFLVPLLFLLLLAALQATTANAADLHVAPAGSDHNPGTAAAPFKTILKASTAARPGDTIRVAPGDYPGSFLTQASGTEQARIRYVSDVKWGARIVPHPDSRRVYAWGNLGDHVDIEGFEIDGKSGTVWRNGIVTRGSNNSMTNNHVHHIADTVPCDNQGGSAINATYLNRGVNAKITANVVHHIGWNGCVFIQGIYMGTSGEVKNNLAYAIGYAAIHLWHDATDVIIANNTVFGSGYGILVGSGDFYYSYRPVDNTHVSNNIAYDNTVGIAERGVHGSHNTYTNNLVYQNSYADWSMDSRHTGTIAADPQFVSYKRDGGGDYRLSGNSPAIGKGSPVHAPPDDLQGAPRVAGIDLGAYAYH
jgi:hypothetical protein